MYTSYIGKKFLNYYNKVENKSYSAKDFFDEILFPIFFDDDKHLMHVGNSAFFQKPTKIFVESSSSKQEAQLKKLHHDIANEQPNMATFVGFAAKDVTNTTSGQLTDMDFNIDSNEMYASWIGQSVSIGVSGYNIAVNNEEVLYNIHKGAKYYREYLQKTPSVKDKQIETWNGHWLIHYYSKNFDNNHIWSNFLLETKQTANAISIPTVLWSRLIFSLTKIFPNQELMIYAYNLSQTNTTLGFNKVYLPAIKRMYEFRDKVFIEKNDSVLTDEQIEFLEPFFGFKSVYQKGTIGLHSIEPKGLRDYLPIGSYKYSKGKSFKVTEKNYTTYLIYKLWVIAMLNKTELLRLAEKLANTLIEYKTEKSEAGRGKKVTEQEVKNILDSRNIKYFIENLTDLMQKHNTNKNMFKEIVEEVLKMPQDNFPLFVTLIKFEYNYQK